MERKTPIKYNELEEPMSFSMSLITLLLKQDNYEDLLALYSYYYYTAKWQKTNQAWATTSYVSKGLKWTETRVRKNKKILLSLGLLEEISGMKKEGGLWEKPYIKVNFIWGQSALYDSRDSGVNGSPVHQETNALSVINKDICLLPANEEEISLYVTPSMFDAFWELYPKKEGKGPAHVAWNKLCARRGLDRVKWRVIERAIRLQKKCERWQIYSQIVQPVNWLNKNFWETDPSTMKAFIDKSLPEKIYDLDGRAGYIGKSELNQNVKRYYYKNGEIVHELDYKLK